MLPLAASKGRVQDRPPRSARRSPHPALLSVVEEKPHLSVRGEATARDPRGLPSPCASIRLRGYSGRSSTSVFERRRGRISRRHDSAGARSDAPTISGFEARCPGVMKGYSLCISFYRRPTKLLRSWSRGRVPRLRSPSQRTLRTTGYAHRALGVCSAGSGPHTVGHCRPPRRGPEAPAWRRSPNERCNSLQAVRT